MWPKVTALDGTWQLDYNCVLCAASHSVLLADLT